MSCIVQQFCILLFQVTMELGSDHFYLVDPFNEMTPVTSDVTYLEGVSRAIYQTLRKGDPEAIW